MATNLRGWTARRPVKIICFILTILLLYGIGHAALRTALQWETTQVSPDIVFISLENDQYFFNSNMYEARRHARTVLRYQSEALILDGTYIQWVSLNDRYERGVYLDAEDYSVHLYGDEDTPAQRRALEQSAIQTQLQRFGAAKAYFESTPGLFYRLESGDFIFENTGGQFDALSSYPVYWLLKNGHTVESSHEGSYAYDSSPSEDAETIALAFTPKAVGASNDVWRAAQTAYSRYFTVIAACAVLFVIAFILLLLGAGRKYGDETKSVHFLPIDRLYLDVGLALVILYEVFVIWCALLLGEALYIYGSSAQTLIAMALGCAFALPPALYWILNAVKQLKARRFLRHTLIARLLGLLRRFVSSLWAGFALTAKVCVILLGAAFSLLFAAALTANEPGLLFIFCLCVIGAAAVLLLRYARRIGALVQGAQAAAEGRGGTPISVGRGELGAIADAINNISAGISAAVEQRMKSERLKTELITNVSHDIRTPLTSLITYTDLLKNEGLDCQRAPEYLDVLIAKSQRLKTLTDELFEAAKAASGSIDVRLEPVNLSELIRQVFGELDERVQSSGLDFRMRLPESAWVMGDGKLLWRIMENLLSNVFKYSLPASRVYLDVSQEGGSVRFDLKNISKDPLNVDPSELTERFKRGDDARAGEGSGLGLSIVQSFAAAQGGQFTITIDGDLFKATLLMPLAFQTLPKND